MQSSSSSSGGDIFLSSFSSSSSSSSELGDDRRYEPEYLHRQPIRIDTTPQDIATKDIPDVVAKTELSLANLHQYVYSLPISSLCSGCRKLHEIEENVAVLKNLKSLSEADKLKLIEIAKPYAGLIVENYKRILG